MDENILNKTLNAPLDLSAFVLLIVIWLLFWHLVLKRILSKCKVTSIWYGLYELGALGSLGIAAFINIIIVLAVASFQAVSEFGFKMLVPIFVFWLLMFVSVALLIKNIKQK